MIDLCEPVPVQYPDGPGLPGPEAEGGYRREGRRGYRLGQDQGGRRCQGKVHHIVIFRIHMTLVVVVNHVNIS